MAALKNVTVKDIQFWMDEVGFRAGGAVIFDLTSDDAAIAGASVTVTLALSLDPQTTAKELSDTLTKSALSVISTVAATDEGKVLYHIDAGVT